MTAGTDLAVPDVVGIVGSRPPDPAKGRNGWRWDDYPLVMEIVSRVMKNREDRGLVAHIVSGGAPGVDSQVKLACRNLGICSTEHIVSNPLSVDCPNHHFTEIPALWHGADGKQKLNRQAGFERNDRLVRHCGLVIALFASGEWTPGTHDVVRRCREYDIPVLIYHEGKWRG